MVTGRRARNDDGTWRRKRSDAGKPRQVQQGAPSLGGFLRALLKQEGRYTTEQ